MKINVLVVDDREEMREFVSWLLVLEQAEVVAAGDGLEAIERLCGETEHPFDLIISDVEMPRMDGWELLAWVHEWRAELPVVLMSGVNNTRVFVRAARIGGARGALPKPLLSAGLHELLEALFDAAGRPRPSGFYCPLQPAA